MEEINGYRLIKTCGACPEQYDVYKDGSMVGYLRLRHGYFYAAYPNVGGEIVYAANPRGDGIFESEEREAYLIAAIIAIDSHIQSIKSAA